MHRQHWRGGLPWRDESQNAVIDRADAANVPGQGRGAVTGSSVRRALPLRADLHTGGGHTPCVVVFKMIAAGACCISARDVLHNPRESVVVRIGIGCKASLQPIAGLLARKQRSGLPRPRYPNRRGVIWDIPKAI